MLQHRPAPKRRSQRPYVVGIVALLILPLLITGLIARRGARDAEARVMQERLALAQATALTASAFMDAQMAAIRSLARSPDITDLGNRPDLAGFLSRSLADTPDWESIEVFQEDGSSVVGTGTEMRPINVGDRPYVRQALETGRPVVGPASAGRRTGDPAVPVVMPVQFVNGATGTLVVWVSTARLQAAIRSLPREETTQVALVDSDGMDFVRSGPTSTLAPALPANESDADQLTTTPSVRRIEAASGVDTVFASSPVGETGWSAVVVQPASAAFGPIRRQLTDELALLVLAAAVIGLIAWFLSRRLSRSYERELEAMSRVDQFISAASHDLKTPLAAIKMMSQLLERRIARAQPADGDWFREGLQSIDAATTKMTAQINELLDVSRLQQERPIEIGRRSADLVSLVTKIAKEQQQTTERHRIRVQAIVPKLAGRLDPDRIERVLNNLIGNAVKYSPDGGEVLVTVGREPSVRLIGAADDERPREWAVVTVTDHGLGIPAADLPLIFDRFHRAANVADRVSGTGIGLASAREIVEQHGGTLSAESVEGEGSTFTVRLPIERRRRAGGRRNTPAGEATTQTQRRASGD